MNRGRSQQEALDATGCVSYTLREDVDVLSIPMAEADEVEVVFFKPDLSGYNGFISDDDLEKEFDLRGLKPADPISVAAVNESDRTFVNKRHHCTHWKDTKGNWYAASFFPCHGKRANVVGRHGIDWDVNWWFAGVRK